MSQPVKLSDDIVLDARLASQVFERSIAGQIEYWAQLGRALEKLMGVQQIIALRSAGQNRSLTECLDEVGSEAGQERLSAYLSGQPYPHYQAHPQRQGFFVRTDADGVKTLGRFVRRQFVVQEA